MRSSSSDAGGHGATLSGLCLQVRVQVRARPCVAPREKRRGTDAATWRHLLTSPCLALLISFVLPSFSFSPSSLPSFSLCLLLLLLLSLLFLLLLLPRTSTELTACRDARTRAPVCMGGVPTVGGRVSVPTMGVRGQCADRGRRGARGRPVCDGEHAQSAQEHPWLGQNLGWLEERFCSTSVIRGAGLFLAADDPRRPG